MQAKFLKSTTILTSFCAVIALGVPASLAVANPTTSAHNKTPQGPTLRIENFIGTIDVVRGGSAITVTDADGAPVSQNGKSVTIDAGYKINNTNCKQNKHSIKIDIGGWKVNKRGGGYKDLADYPHMKISAPVNTHLVIEKSVIFGDVADIGSGDVHVRSCGDLNIGNVAHNFKLSISGSGDVDMGNVGGSLDARVSGSGDASIGDAGRTNIYVSGSGDLELGKVARLDLRVSGSGDVSVGDIAGVAEIRASGSSDIELGRIDGGLDYEGSGSSDVSIDYITGDASLITSGSGDIDIDDGNVGKLHINASGASTVRYKGKSKSAEAYASGASDITINAPSGSLRSHEGGAGDVHIKKVKD